VFRRCGGISFWLDASAYDFDGARLQSLK